MRKNIKPKQDIDVPFTDEGQPILISVHPQCFPRGVEQVCLALGIPPKALLTRSRVVIHVDPEFRALVEKRSISKKQKKLAP